ncbi:TPA: hypothetical protein ACH3X1_001642 [Trebouxia sp. C0004]
MPAEEQRDGWRVLAAAAELEEVYASSTEVEISHSNSEDEDSPELNDSDLG